MDQYKDYIIVGPSIGGAWLAGPTCLSELIQEGCHRAELWPSLRGVSISMLGSSYQQACMEAVHRFVAFPPGNSHHTRSTGSLGPVEPGSYWQSSLQPSWYYVSNSWPLSHAVPEVNQEEKAASEEQERG